MNRIKIILLLLSLALACNKIHAGSPVSAKQILKHSDWNFVENKGQVSSPEIWFYGHQGGVYLYCQPGKISFVFTKAENTENNVSEATGVGKLSLPNPRDGGRGWKNLESPSRPEKITTSRTDLILLNSNPTAQILASDQQEYYENYYTTGDADHGITNVHTYKTITYKEIYPNIDMVLRAIPTGMKYEFIVHPGGNISDIKMQWDGLEGIKKLKDSKIEYSFALGKMSEEKPVSFQGKNIIETDFNQHSNLVGFKVNRYDKSKDLVIDPTLIWGTYFGGTSDDESHGVATDPAGNIFITGHTGSTRYIATPGAYITYFAGTDDDNDDSLGLEDGDDFGGFLSKFDPNGKLIWSTYYNADCYHVAVDNQGSAYITGWASTEIATTKGAYQNAKGGTFLSKFKGNGQLAWATYYGNAIDSGGSIIGYGVACDDSDNIYLTGTLAKALHAVNTKYVADSEAFLAKFSSIGAFQWSTTLGKRVLFGGAVATDHYGNIYITTATSDTDGIATSGAYQTSFGGGLYRKGSGNTIASYSSDAVLAQYNGNGKLQWATYFGGEGNEISGGVATDRYGYIYISGNTSSLSGIATHSAYQTTSQGDDAYLAKFTANGNLLWATYYGGDFATVANAVATDGSKNAYIAGYTSCPDGIATSNAYQQHIKGGENTFVAEFSTSGKIQWATYYGGNGIDNSLDITTDAKAKIYITGLTNSNKGMTTSGAYQVSYRGGGNDAFLAQFYNKSDINDAGIDSIISPTGSYCKDTLPVFVRLKNYNNNELDSVKIILSANGKILSSFPWSGKLLKDSSIRVNMGNIVFPTGTDSIQVWTDNPNGGLDSFPGNDTSKTVINCYPLPAANAGPDTILCYNESYTMQGSGGVTYAWHPATYLSSSSDPNAIAILPNTERYILVVTNNHGCTDSGQVLLKVRPKLQVKITGDSEICYGKNIFLFAKAKGGDSANYKLLWPYDNRFTGDSLNEKVLATGWHKVILSDNCSPVQATDSVYITVIPPAKAAFSWLPDSPLVKNPIPFNNQSSNASKYLWDFGNEDSSIMISPVYKYNEKGRYQIELVAYGIDQCPNDSAYGFINIISNQIYIYIPNAFSPNGDGTNDLFEISGFGIKSYSYNIYNRWGEHIFEGNSGHPFPSGIPGEAAWDGSFKGQQVPEGVYIYIFDIIDIEGQHHYLSGNVTLMR